MRAPMLWLGALVVLLAASTALDSSWRFVPLGCSAIAAVVSMERQIHWHQKRARRLRERSGRSEHEEADRR